ncbi:MAG: D-glycero-alpha-D-manno-heptose-1,7-bisphosphate 7-phosphatase [Chitinophagaceae bacterium]
MKDPKHKLPLTDASWTLFLDRDGVINQDNINGYILTWKEFQFNPGVLEAMPLLSRLFQRIVVITNQRGVGKGLMTLTALQHIHTQMTEEIVRRGGRIDQVYFCTALENEHPDRKPNPGMALQAKHDFPEIDFSKTIMVGNTRSDMEFGRTIGAYTVYIHNREDKIPAANSIDAEYDGLLSMAMALANR